VAIDLTRIDLSSWTSWASWGAAFALAVNLDPGMADAIAGGGVPLLVLLAPIAAFFVAVVWLQRHLRLELAAAHYGAPAELVTSGPFRYSRNPIYVAFLPAILSLGYFSLLAAAVGLGLYLAGMTFVVIAREEADLARAFPTAFPAYCAQTPRWLLV
jgi:protein-S-isoprenylcysteine O-methyltransferase Ste14